MFNNKYQTALKNVTAVQPSTERRLTFPQLLRLDLTQEMVEEVGHGRDHGGDGQRPTQQQQ